MHLNYLFKSASVLLVFASSVSIFAATPANTTKPNLSLQQTAESELQINNSGRAPVDVSQNLTDTLVFKADEVTTIRQQRNPKFIGLHYRPQKLSGLIEFGETESYSADSIGELEQIGLIGGYSLSNQTFADGVFQIEGELLYGKKNLNLTSSYNYTYENAQFQMLTAGIGGSYTRAIQAFPRLAYQGKIAAQVINLSQSADNETAKWSRLLGVAQASLGLRARLFASAFIAGHVDFNQPIQSKAIQTSATNFSLTMGTDL